MLDYTGPGEQKYPSEEIGKEENDLTPLKQSTISVLHKPLYHSYYLGRVRFKDNFEIKDQDMSPMSVPNSVTVTLAKRTCPDFSLSLSVSLS